MPANDRKIIIQGVEELGGYFTVDMTEEVTHLITVHPESSAKYQYAVNHPELGIKIVLPHWFQTCFNLRRRFPEEAGGTILEDENEYDPDVVDVVICRYRKGRLYKQASKDGKIVASVDWLLHILQTGKLTSPMASLLHYPIPFRPIPGMSDMVMTISNYNGPIREYIKRLIVTMGATYKPTLTSPFATEPTTHIICGDASGEKYEKGQEWNVKVVNHLWIEDCFLEWTIQSETKHKYVYLPPHSQLSFVFGAKLPPEQIEEWVDMADGTESDARSDTAPKQSRGIEVKAESAKSDKPSRIAVEKPALEEVGTVHHENNAAETEHGLSTSKTLVKNEADMEVDENPPVKRTEYESNPDTGASGIRVVSRMRGAALEASKNLRKNVSDMNAFQQELRNEKRAPKKKRKIIDQDGDTVRDGSTEPEGGELGDKSVVAADEPMSPGKKRRTQATPVVTSKSSKKGKAVPAQAEETQDIEVDEEHEETSRSTTKKAALKETKDGASTSSSPKGPVRYITTSTVKIPAKLVKQLKALGITEAKSVEQCTHLVANSIVRTEKFLYAIPACKEIVHEDWLQACVDANQILDEAEYPVKDATNEKKYKFKLADAMKRARQGRVFEGYLFYFTPNTQPKLGVLKPMVEIGGGKTAALLQTGLSFIGEKIRSANEHAKRKDWKAMKKTTSKRRKGQSSAASKEEQSGEDEKDEDESASESESESDEQERTIIVISSKEDSDMWKPVLDAGSSIYSTELVLTGLFRQDLELGPTHKLA
ncbi:hypothetical protein BGW42_005358 [Actinomortierella wolfii]|nr:hypothetical protein BGW42_005358 [Actinomortierella wolfii]